MAEQNKLRFIPDCDIATLKPYVHNPRDNDKAVYAVAKSIESFGFISPIIVNEKMQICCGHTRLKAATQNGLDRVPVIVVSNLVADKFAAYNIADNQTAQIADWNEQLLAEVIAELQSTEIDLEALGFSDSELQTLIELAGKPAGNTDPDECPPLPTKPETRPGDLYILCDHRLLCGDATSASDVGVLIDIDTEPLIMVTDPPYGVEYDPGWRTRVKGKVGGVRRQGKVQNDNIADWLKAYELFPGNIAYVWHAAKFGAIVAAGLEAVGLSIHQQIIWNKQHFIISRSHYHWKHEPCWYAVRKGKTANWSGGRKQSTVWDIANHCAFGGQTEDCDSDHGTQKPVECMARPIRNHGGPKDAVYDPFVGSGTTIIAAEILGRRCFAMDIDPVYCDVAVERWEKFTGREAEIVRSVA